MQNSKLQLKIKIFLISFWPLLFLIGLWFVFASPYFARGKVPYSSTYQVNFFAPWSHYEKFWGPIKNNAMPDIIDQIYPWKHFTIETWKKGQVPFWNPNSFAGNPHLANYQSAVLSPFNIVFFILPFIDAWSVVVLLQPLLAGLFTYLFMRSLTISKEGSFISSIAFMFCGFMVVWMAYGTLSMAIVFLPLALFAIEKYTNTKHLRFLFLLSITIPLSFFSGHFQTSVYFLLSVILYVFYKGFSEKKIIFLFSAFLSIIIGIFLSLPQILPSIQLYDHSVRSDIFIKGGGIPFHYLVTSFAPDFFGNPVTRNDWFGFYAEWSSFVGIVPLLLAIYGIFHRNKRSLFFILLGFFSLCMAVDSPLQFVIGFLKIPVLSTSNPTRIIVLFSFSVAVLAGIGLDIMQEFIKQKKTKKIISPFLAIGIFLLFIWGIFLIDTSMSGDKTLIAKRNLIIPTGLYFGTLLLVLFSRFHKKFLLLTTWCLLLATSFDSLRFAQKWMPFDPKNLVFPDIPVIHAMQKNIGYGRVFGNLGAHVDTYYNLPSIEGYDPLYIGRYGEFIRSATEGQFIEGERSVVKTPRIGRYTDRALDLLGVALVFHPIADTNQGWAYPVWKDTRRYSLIYTDDKFQLFKNNQALSRASLFYNVETIKDSKEEIKRFYSDSFDFRNTLLLEEPIESIGKQGTGSAEIRSYTPNKILISATTSEPALLFLADTFYPGWIAKVNGNEVKIFRADYTFRAVLIPKGTSIVEFNYENWHF